MTRGARPSRRRRPEGLCHALGSAGTASSASAPDQRNSRYEKRKDTRQHHDLFHHHSFFPRAVRRPGLQYDWI